VVVVDASALAAVIFHEPDAAVVVRALSGQELRAPALLPFELTNIARTKSRQQPSAAGVIDASLRIALSQPITFDAVDFGAVLALSLETGLSAYDASYLWLARHLDVRLVTLDKQLASYFEG
jgi:predicted nucleic acid-binding protein